MKIFIKGLATGLLLQMAIGPVFFFIINLALQKSLYDGFAGVIAVTLVDYFYITLAILGIISLATLIFMSSSALLWLIQVLNLIVGGLLIAYGGIRLRKILKSS